MSDRQMRLDEAMASTHVVGAAVACFDCGEQSVARAGLADLENGVSVMPDTRFGLWSVTKPVTTIVALSLVEEGRIALDDPIDDLIPELGVA